jgi:hypothetical protein
LQQLKRQSVRRVLVAAALILVHTILAGFGLGGQIVSSVEAQGAAISRCVEVVPYYLPVGPADARLLCPGIVESMRDAHIDQELDGKNYCDLFLVMGLDDNDDSAKMACQAVFVAVLDSVPVAAPPPPAPGPVAPKPPAVVSAPVSNPAAVGGTGAAWVDQAVRDYQVSRRQQGIPYTAADLARFYQCLSGQAANGQAAALQACVVTSGIQKGRACTPDG